MGYKIMELYSVAGFLTLYTLIFYQMPIITQGWREFLARTQTHSSTKPIDKNEARKNAPLLHHKYQRNYLYPIV
jgi:hypothetical protein